MWITYQSLCIHGQSDYCKRPQGLVKLIRKRDPGAGSNSDPNRECIHVKKLAAFTGLYVGCLLLAWIIGNAAGLSFRVLIGWAPSGRLSPNQVILEGLIMGAIFLPFLWPSFFKATAGRAFTIYFGITFLLLTLVLSLVMAISGSIAWSRIGLDFLGSLMTFGPDAVIAGAILYALRETLLPRVHEAISSTHVQTRPSKRSGPIEL